MILYVNEIQCFHMANLKNLIKANILSMCELCQLLVVKYGFRHAFTLPVFPTLSPYDFLFLFP